ncbi:MAG: hypothetical protein Q7T71_16395, partial [Herbiconiux sp.]|nr:hypothetical protein [Herbiconiux sp.]
IGDERPADVLGFARAAVAEAAPEAGGEATGIELVGIEQLQSEKLDEPFGRLEFRVRDAFVEEGTGTDRSAPDGDAGAGETENDSLAFCFRVTFDYYGKVGEWSTTEGVEPVDCVPGAEPVVPPVDTTERRIVAANAREAARSVLEQRAATGEPRDADAIEAAISALLEPPTGAYEAAATPSVLVQSGASGAGDRVGVVMGGADDCVLVKLEDGQVSDVRPAPVLLQPGELGCSAETALADPDLLRSPH